MEQHEIVASNTNGQANKMNNTQRKVQQKKNKKTEFLLSVIQVHLAQSRIQLARSSPLSQLSKIMNTTLVIINR